MPIGKVGLTILLSTAGLWLLWERLSTAEADATASAQSEYLAQIRDSGALVAVQVEF
jgi:hypothetical protein